MADRKYGRMFTMGDVAVILEWVEETGESDPHKLLAMMDKAGVRFKFSADEPTFTFRGRDRRADGALKHYEDHQSPNAPLGFTEGIAAARRDFREFREEHPELMKEPD